MTIKSQTNRSKSVWLIHLTKKGAREAPTTAGTNIHQLTDMDSQVMISNSIMKGILTALTIRKSQAEVPIKHTWAAPWQEDKVEQQVLRHWRALWPTPEQAEESAQDDRPFGRRVGIFLFRRKIVFLRNLIAKCKAVIPARFLPPRI